MSSLFKSFHVPVNDKLQEHFEVACRALEKKLFDLDAEQLTISDYSKKYFKDYQRKLRYSLQACAFILMHALHKSKKELHEITIVDYGAGTGVLAMLAKQIGFARVIYNDIYDVSCHDAQKIAEAVHIPADAYLCGDAGILQQYAAESNRTFDIIVSRNVVEHIYDLNLFFQSLTRLPGQELTLFFATTANIKNPLTVWYTKRIQKRVEFRGMTTKWGKERDALKPFLQIRKEIIAGAFPQLSDAEIAQLALCSRGLIKRDILNLVSNYTQTKTLPKNDSLDFNTCDPHTGNWAEHLVETDVYATLFQKNGFDFKLRNGFYNTSYAQQIFNLITPIINFFIRNSGKRGIYLAPFIAFEGKRKN